MGALHEGHVSLIDRAREEGATFLVATIFVNPLQFGEGEDLDRYPRTLDADVRALSAKGVHLVFAPNVEEMYGDGFATTVRVAGLTDTLEGAHRPGHFDGVTTVVTKLLNLVSPAIAVFGQKDFQQQAIIRRMTKDLDIRAEIVTSKTVRESDGLALSSRNRYLDDDQRSRALGIFRGLRAAEKLFSEGNRDPDALVAAARAEIAPVFDSIDYVAAVDPETFEPAAPGAERLLIATAAHLGSTRLIDNVLLDAG
jgi:pantoate--beta-alanine ligase